MSTDLTTVGMDETALAKPGAAAQLPTFLQERRDQGLAAKGTENLGQYFVPPRLKLVQDQTAEDIKALFGSGAAVVVPHNVPVVLWDSALGHSAPFTFIPLFSFTEFATVNPRNVNDANGNPLPFIRERSNDIRSEIAIRARNFKDKSARFDVCPESKDPNKKIRYVEFLNFLCIIENVPDLQGMPVHFSFWSTGHADGRNLANLILARQGVDMFAQRFQATVTPRKNAEGNWKGLTIQTPLNAPAFVQTEAEYKAYERKHEEIQKMYKERTMQMEYEGDESGENTIEVPANAEY